MTKFERNCILCGKVITDVEFGDSWKEVTGFVGGPKKDSMRLRSDTGYHAHGNCVFKAGIGQSPDQEELI